MVANAAVSIHSSYHAFADIAAADRRFDLLDRLCRTAQPPSDVGEYHRDLHALREIVSAIAPPRHAALLVGHFLRVYDDQTDLHQGTEP